MHKQQNSKLTRQYERPCVTKQKPTNQPNEFLGKIMRSCLMAMLVMMGFGYNASSEASDNIVHRLKKTGILTVGTSLDSAPFASRVSGNKFAGFAIDIIEEIANGISDDLKITITTKFIGITTRKAELLAVKNREVDIFCGSTTPTWEREKLVDFSVPFFIDGIRLLTFNKYGKSGVFGLQTKTIGVIKGSTSFSIIQSKLPDPRIKTFPNNLSAMAALEKKSIDAFADDGIVLESLRVNSKQENNLMLVPKSGVIVWETISCILPENQSKFKDLVNIQLMKMLNGLESLSGKYAKIYFRWFGVDGVLNYPLDKTRQNKLLSSNIWLN